MSTAAVGTTDLKAGASPPARTAGLFCLLVFFFNGSALFVRSGLVISGDAAATASNIMAHASRFWLGLTCNLIMIACFIAVTTLFYELFKPVNRSVSLLAAFFSLMGCAAQTFSFLFYIAPLVRIITHSSLDVCKMLFLAASRRLFGCLRRCGVPCGISIGYRRRSAIYWPSS